MSTYLHKNINVTPDGRLAFAGLDTTKLAKKHGTPLMLLDEQGIRNNIRMYKGAMEKNFGIDYDILYAGKALCITALYKILQEEGIGADIMSGGEIYTALGGGFDIGRAYIHGNFKSESDLEYAMKNGIGCIVLDSFEDAQVVNRVAARLDRVQKVLLRLIPGVDPNTHQKISTGGQTSKFGVSIQTGEAEKTVEAIMDNLKNVILKGFHSHIGSQIFEIKPFCAAAEVMIDFMAQMKMKRGFAFSELNLGGGWAVRYVDSQPAINYADHVDRLGAAIREACKKAQVKQPKIILEPGRSIIAANGMTLYTAGAVKHNPAKNWIIVDGGMTDNPRFALYGSLYTVYTANKMNYRADFTATIGGRCCESGDILQENVSIPTPQTGDILAFAVTGAYNYSMASNYNRIPRPAIIMIDGKVDRVVVRRETFEDLARLDITE